MQHRERISLFGYGITTRAIADAFGPFTFYDDHVNKPFVDEKGNRVRPSGDFDPRYSDLSKELIFCNVHLSQSGKDEIPWPR